MGVGGHDVTHVLRLAAMEQEIAEVLTFDHYEYQATVWLHNVDRSPLLEKSISRFDSEDEKLIKILFSLFGSSPFGFKARNRIVNAVSEHSKKDDGPNDSTLLQALRLADKWDRIGPFGIVAGSAFRGGFQLPYEPGNPFGYESTAEGKMKTLYHDFFRILEWYPQFSLVRALVAKRPERMQLFLAFVRAYGAEMAERSGIKNLVEQDIKRVLGDFYDEFQP